MLSPRCMERPTIEICKRVGRGRSVRPVGDDSYIKVQRPLDACVACDGGLGVSPGTLCAVAFEGAFFRRGLCRVRGEYSKT